MVGEESVIWGEEKELSSVNHFSCPEKTNLKKKKDELVGKVAMPVDKTTTKENIRRTCTLCRNKDFSSQWKEMLLFLSNSMPGEGGGGGGS